LEPLKPHIPQQEPFVMVDYIINLSATSCTTSLTIKPDNLLIDGTYFSEAGILEHIAQSAAAWNSEKNKKSSKSQIGVIGSIRNCQIERLPHIGETLQTTITTEVEVANKQVVHAITQIGDQTIAQAYVNIALL